ncbi:hypothetical protein K439DRAFT_1625219 [Ramaria rubella]|nr:hypothetical protein K439DRAFT_1625219 [Ramaria rubella]
MTCHSVPSAFREEWLQEPVDLSSRDLLLFKFCQYNNHPLWPHGKAFVYEADTSPEVQLALLKHAKDHKIVRRFEDDLKQQGKLQLLPYQAIFVRKKDHTDTHDDVIQLWVSDGRLYDAISPTFKDEGPKTRHNMAVPEKPQRVKSLGAFTLSEAFINLDRVNANSKLPDDKDHQLRNRMLKTYAAISVVAMKLALESVQRAVQLKADLVNSPLIVQDDNFYHHESQINMSQAQMYNGPLTITNLGPSGDRHNDNNDEESGYSNASVHSHLPVEYHPGLFMFYGLGMNRM